MGIKAAHILCAQLIENPKTTLGLATGATPVSLYKELIDLYNRGVISFEKCKSFNLDEYLGLEQNNEQSYYSFMHHNLFKHVNMEKYNIHIPNGMALNPEIECTAYESLIDKNGGIDVQILGIGRNGHIGFNEPKVKFESTTHVVELDDKTIQDNARFFDTVDEVPKQAITMGIKTIMKAKKIILLATGENKRDILKKAIYGEITPSVPASILQLHPNVLVIVDEDAGKWL